PRTGGCLPCGGSYADGHGGGTYTLSLDPDFGAELAKRGVGAPTSEQQGRFARAAFQLDLLDELKDQGYPTPRITALVRMVDHGVNDEFVRGLGMLRYRLRSPPRAVADG